MSVPRLTTPTFTLQFPETASIDLTEADEVYVTFGYRDKSLFTKDSESLTVGAKSIGVYLSQSDTNLFPVGDIQIQANWIIDGSRYASDIAVVNISVNLLNEVVTSD